MIYNVKTVEELYHLQGKVAQEIIDWMEVSLDCYEIDYSSPEVDGDGLYIVEQEQDLRELFRKYSEIKSVNDFQTACKVGALGYYMELVYPLKLQRSLWLVCPVNLLPQNILSQILEKMRKVEFKLLE